MVTFLMTTSSEFSYSQVGYRAAHPELDLTPRGRGYANVRDSQRAKCYRWGHELFGWADDPSMTMSTLLFWLKKMAEEAGAPCPTLERSRRRHGAAYYPRDNRIVIGRNCLNKHVLIHEFCHALVPTGGRFPYATHGREFAAMQAAGIALYMTWDGMSPQEQWDHYCLSMDDYRVKYNRALGQACISSGHLIKLESH